MFKTFKKLNAAKAVICVFLLAVLFFLLSPAASAQGLKMDLEVKANNYSYHQPISNNVGLCLAFKELTLLQNRIVFNRNIAINYEDEVVELDDKLGSYPVSRNFPLRLDSYLDYALNHQFEQSWKKNLNLSLTKIQRGESSSLFEFDIPIKFPSIVSKFIGEGGPNLKITGKRRISFSGSSNWTEGAVKTAAYKPSKWPSLKMEQSYNFRIDGSIGSKIFVDVIQDSETQTELENRIHLKYIGEEDEILQRVEAGNTTLGVRNSLVGYSQTVRGLFGIKALAKLGRLNLTMITSQEKASNEKAEFKAGAESSKSIIRDYDYYERRFYYLGRSEYLGKNQYTSYDTLTRDFQAGDTLIEFELYRSTDSDASHGLACVDLTDTSLYRDAREYRKFTRVEEKDYYVYRNMTEEIIGNTKRATLPFVQLFFPLGESEILAYYAAIQRKIDGRIDTIYVGSIDSTGSSNVDDTTFLLKLLKPEKPLPQDITWEYEWRNVYWLKSRPIDKDGLKIDVYKGAGENTDVDLNHQNGERYLQLLRLDRFDQDGNEVPDGIIDFSQIDFEHGLLFFPDRHPFDLDTLEEKVSPIYNSNVRKDRTDASTYYISVESKSRRSEYNLRANIIEGSELVTLNGNPLARGRDYQIDYQTGTITFLTEQAADPTSDIKVDYEYAPFIMAERKSLYGLQADYVTEGGLRLNGVALYKSEKSYEQKPRIGEEPKRNFVWGADFAYSLTPPIMTKLVDALPFFGTEEPSKLDLALRVAQSIPNPNLKNEAYIDDFEGSRNYTDLSVLRRAWTLSSLPEGDWQRARMIWYNPYDQVLLQEVWPGYQVQEKNRLTHVLDLVLYPNRPHAPIDSTFDSVSVDSSCNGIMRSFGPGSWNQTRTRFLELWIKSDWYKSPQGRNGILRIDLGEISEDIDADNVLDTEDQEVMGQRNGILEDHEDVGLDGMTNEQERIFYNSNLDDPSGDDWVYSNKYVYTQINGTDRNSLPLSEEDEWDGERGKTADTEDINYNEILDKDTNYYEFTIDLNETFEDTSVCPYYVPGYYPTHWILFRIPLQEIPDSNKVGNPDLSNIRFARIWLSPSDPIDTDPILVRFASIELVGNKWESAGVIPMYEVTESSVIRNKVSPIEYEPVPEDTIHGSLEVFVINTYENKNYESPPGVAGEKDEYTDVVQREQSLVLKYQDIAPGYLGMAERYLYRVEDYTNYQRLKMFVHGRLEDDTVKFFYRMGTDPKNFYEYQTYVYPGWDPRNEVEIDFSQITALKNYMLINAAKDSVAVPDTIAGNYRIKGNPTLSVVRWFAVGVYNDPTSQYSNKKPKEISGEIWVNELRVTDVRKVPGWTYSGSITAKLADLGNLSVTYSRKDSEFRGLTGEKGSGTVSTGLAMRFGTSFEKFLPTSWGLSLPFSFDYSKAVHLPRLKPGSDIVLPTELRNEERSETISKRFSFFPRFVRDTNNWFLRLILKRLSLNQSIFYSRTDSRSPNTPVSRAQTYGFGLKYDMTPGKNLTISPFKVFKSVFLLKKLSSETISFLPTNLIFSSSFKGSKSLVINSVGDTTSSYTRDLIGNINASMSPLKTVQATYRFVTNRDIRYNKDIKFSFNPKKAKLGIEISRSQNFNVNYRPKWVGILDQSFTFTSSYKENADPQIYQGTRVVGNSSNKNANFTFYWQRIFRIFKPKPRGQKEGKGINPLDLLRGFVGNLSTKLSSLTINYRIMESSNKSGLLKRPSLAYQFGFTHKTNIPLSPDPKFSGTDGLRNDKRLDLSSGLGITSNINISNFRYSRGVTTTITSGKPVRDINLTFPDMRVTWNRLERLEFFKRFAASASYTFGYKKQVRETEDGITKRLTNRDITTSFSPLISLNMTLKNRIQMNFNWDRQITEKQNLSYLGGASGKTISTSETYGINAAYSFSAPKGIKLPFLKKIKFQSALNLSLAISLRQSQTKRSVWGKGFVVSADSKEFSLTPRASYSFSSQVRGGLSGRWVDSKNNMNGEKRHVRELGLWAEFSF